MGILGMLNLLKEQLPEKEIDDLRSLNENDLKITFTKSYFKYFIKRKDEALTNNERKLNESISKLKSNSKNLDDKKAELKEIVDQQCYYKKLLYIIDHQDNWRDIKREIQEKSNEYEVVQEAKKRIPLSIAFYTNYKFFNNTSRLESQLNDWENLIINGHIENELLEGTINKLTVGFNDYPNIFYAKPEITSFISTENNLHIPLICHFKAYNEKKLAGKYYFFYSADINFCFSVNRKLQTIIKNVGDSEKLLNVTWQAVFDALYEHKSDWALQNMYLVSYSTINNQQRFENVEFIGLSKVNAAIITNDTIRENLNEAVFTSLKFKNDGWLNEGESAKKWLIQEVINNSSLLDLIFRILSIHAAPKKLKENPNRFIVHRNKMIMTLSVCIHKITLSKTEMQAFRGDIFYQNTKFKNLPKKIIETDKLIKNHNRLYYSLFLNEEMKKTVQEEKKEQAEFGYLVRLIKRKEINLFTNFIIQKLLKAANSKGNQTAKNFLTSFLFRHIVNNPLWQYYALGLIFKNFNQIDNYEQSNNDE